MKGKKYDTSIARPHRMKDITGEKFNDLEVISFNPKKSTTCSKKWNCRCLRCGNICIKDGYALRSGKYKCCSECAIQERSDKSRYQMTGQRYGKLTVIEEDIQNKKVTCLCDCGNKVVLRRGDVLSGHTLSCGCYQKKRAGESNYKDRSGYISAYGVKIMRPVKKNKKGVWLYECECPLCGKIFEEIPARIKNGHVKSCGCMKDSQLSAPHKMIAATLREKNIDFIDEYSFDDCKHKYRLRYDFAIFFNNEVVGVCEYDGEQHFVSIPFWGGDKGLELTQKRDRIKNEYCKKHNIPMLRLNYKMNMNEIKSRVISEYKQYVKNA